MVTSVLTPADTTAVSFVVQSASSSWPESMSFPYVLLGRIAHGWEIIQPLQVMVDIDEDGYYTASDNLFLVYGDGNTLAEALQDYRASLVDYYQLLDARSEDDPPTQALFRRVRRYLRSTNR
jgi:hypothetical protein